MNSWYVKTKIIFKKSYELLQLNLKKKKEKIISL